MERPTDVEHDTSHGRKPCAHFPHAGDARLVDETEKNEYAIATSNSPSSIDTLDTDFRILADVTFSQDLATEAEHLADLDVTKTGPSLATQGSRLLSFEVDFGPNDPEDPRNWPLWYRGLLITAISYSTWTVVLYSTSYTSSMPGMMTKFDETSEPIATLGMTTYLLGLAVGSLILAPLSEIYGRRPIYMGSLVFYTVLVLPCALATSLSEVLIVRFFGALAGSAMISNAPGTVSDIVTETYRALAYSIWSIAPMNGPVTGPLIGGFTAEYLGWRWTNWLVMILGGAGCIFLSCFKETYAPRILQNRAAKLRKETGDDRWWCRYDQKLSRRQILKVNLSRPFVLAFTEPILWFWNVYIAVSLRLFPIVYVHKDRDGLAIIYAILYLCFVAYPIIYSELRGWSLGDTGFAFIGIGIGTMIAIVTEPLARRLINMHKKDPDTGRVPPEAAVSIVCIASFLCPIGQLWFSWTSVPITIHWVWPILAGIPFGAGNSLVFIYASNYLAGAYGIYAASALAGNAVIRSFAGGTLPLAGPAMYAALTPQWAGTLLGLVQVALIPIPFVFYKWGAKIRSKSRLIKQMREDQEIRQKKQDSAARGRERKMAAGKGALMMMNGGYDGDVEGQAAEKI